MTDQLISFETAKLAKKKGFNEETSHYYDLIDNKLKHTIEGFSNPNEDCMIDIELEWHNHSNFNRLAAPTQSLLQKWLREKHELHVGIYYRNVDKSWITEIFYTREYMKNGRLPYTVHKTYEEALEQGLIEALKLIP